MQSRTAAGARSTSTTRAGSCDEARRSATSAPSPTRRAPTSPRTCSRRSPTRAARDDAGRARGARLAAARAGARRLLVRPLGRELRLRHRRRRPRARRLRARPTTRASAPRVALARAACRTPDGGFGEDLRSYRDRSWSGRGVSTASQTAWALLGLHAAGEGDGAAASAPCAGSSRRSGRDGGWDEPYFTGTGFPGDFYLNYHLYRDVFPVMALGRIARSRGADASLLVLVPLRIEQLALRRAARLARCCAPGMGPERARIAAARALAIDAPRGRGRRRLRAASTRRSRAGDVVCATELRREDGEPVAVPGERARSRRAPPTRAARARRAARSRPTGPRRRPSGAALDGRRARGRHGVGLARRGRRRAAARGPAGRRRRRRARAWPTRACCRRAARARRPAARCASRSANGAAVAAVQPRRRKVCRHQELAAR